MHRTFLKFGAFFALIAVILGAFGAHSLKAIFPEKAIIIYETGVRYQFYHSIALLICGMIYREFANKFTVLAGRFFTAGIILFSGSLYFLTFLIGAHNDSLNWVGILTPIGGVFFITGWVLLILAVRRIK
ncbi:MAG: DUF423 domain-containing protein [Ginsengibacter sp.]